MGLACRYDGNARPLAPPLLTVLEERYVLVPVCPELLGGLPVPRPPAERQGERYVNRDGADVTAAYRLGARETLSLAIQGNCIAALLKERSPSCGCGEIYDGSFSGTLIPGDGAAAQLLKRYGIPVYGESRVHELL